ncbi:MAG: T9SS type A sorting domain-containing protein [Bacteroidetes bacterium]|nr:T9SS type A sorting domain-containing protein [Bacteroidota bacterium]
MKKTITYLAIICSAFLFSSISYAQTSQWTALTSGTSNNLVGVDAISADTVFVAGQYGTILKTTNGGATWVTQTSGTSQQFYDIKFINSNVGFAVGDNGAVVKTINGGTNWTNVSLTSQSMRVVKFINSTTGFITGAGSTIFRTTDGGSTWTSISAGASNIYGVCFTSATKGYISCFDGTMRQTVDGGSTWTSLASIVSTQLNTIQFTNPTTGIVVGASGVIRKTINSGLNWSTVIMTTTPDFLANQIFLDANNGFVTGGNIANNTGIILSTTDGGSNWTTYLPGTSRLCNVDFPNANVGYSPGLNGTILKYTSNVGISKNATNKPKSITAYPNPTNNSITVDLAGYEFNGSAFFELFDISGKLIYEIKDVNTDKLVIQKNNLNTGIYFFKISDLQKLIGTGKIIIE